MSSKPSRIGGIVAELLDNLWVWAVVIMIITFIYATWAILESVTMHTPEIPPKPP